MTDEQLIERIRAGLREEVAGLYPPGNLLGRLRPAPTGRPHPAFRVPAGVGGAVAMLASIVVVVVVAAAFVSLGHSGSSPAGVSSVPSGTPAGARALVARLALLRRPQTAADRLPASLRAQFPTIGLGFRIIPGLTRLAATIDAGSGPLSSVDIYIVVGAPPGVPVDIVTTLAVAGPSAHRYLLGLPEVVDDQTAVATGGLTPTAVGSAGEFKVESSKTSSVTVPTGQSGVNVSVVPDGVTHVKWVFGAASLRRLPRGRFRRPSASPVTVYPQIENNIAVSKAAGSEGLSGATWYGPDGRVIASLSPQAQLQAEHARALAASDRDPIAPVLPAHFAVFRRPAPPPASIKFPPAKLAIAAIGNNGYDQDNGYRVNIAQARFVPYPGTRGFWVIPGSRGVSMAEMGSGGNSVPLSGPGSALSGGMITTSCCAAHREAVWGLVPDGNPSVTVVLASGARRTVAVIDNVYSFKATRIAAVIAKDAAGRRITIKAPG